MNEGAAGFRKNVSRSKLQSNCAGSQGFSKFEIPILPAGQRLIQIMVA
jgi:hypothetical protein